MTKSFLSYTGYLKKTPNHIMLKRWKEIDWELKCAEQGFGTKKNIGSVGGNSNVYYLTVNNGGE